MNENHRYNMHGRLIEFNAVSGAWSWSRWEYVNRNGGRVVARHSGLLQFQKVFRSVVEDCRENVRAESLDEIRRALKKQGVDFIFLFQGAIELQEQFRTVEEAERYYHLDECEPWDLTDYWFGFDADLNSWAMYDTFTGALRFTPQGKMASQGGRISHPAAPTRLHAQRGVVYREISNTVY